MIVYFASDHAGFELKNELLAFVRDELGLEVKDCGAHTFDVGDDYPDFIRLVAEAVSRNPVEARAIILGGSGQGEAMCANKYAGVRAVVYYGAPLRSQTDADGQELDMVMSTRVHNDANVLSLGVRFLDTVEAKEAVKMWLETPFSQDARHVRRIKKLEEHLR